MADTNKRQQTSENPGCQFTKALTGSFMLHADQEDQEQKKRAVQDNGFRILHDVGMLTRDDRRSLRLVDKSLHETLEVDFWVNELSIETKLAEVQEEINPRTGGGARRGIDLFLFTMRRFAECRQPTSKLNIPDSTRQIQLKIMLPSPEIPYDMMFYPGAGYSTPAAHMPYLYYPRTLVEYTESELFICVPDDQQPEFHEKYICTQLKRSWWMYPTEYLHSQILEDLYFFFHESIEKIKHHMNIGQFTWIQGIKISVEQKKWSKEILEGLEIRMSSSGIINLDDPETNDHSRSDGGGKKKKSIKKISKKSKKPRKRSRKKSKSKKIKRSTKRR